MTIQEMVRADFEEFIRLDPAVPPELKTSLRLKERVPDFMDRLAKEIAQVEAGGIKLDRHKIKQLVYNLSAFFVHCMKVQADQMYMSDIAKTAVKKHSQELEKFDKDGNADLTEEFGIIIKDKVMKQ